MRNMSDTFMDEADYFKHSTTPNDEVERRGTSPTSNEADLSRSSTPSLAHRRRDPRSLEPIVRCQPWTSAESHSDFELTRRPSQCLGQANRGGVGLVAQRGQFVEP